MSKQGYPPIIHLSEARNTWGCHYTIPGSDKVYYGFSELPPNSSLWLDCASGDAVEQILAADGGSVISTQRGAYGGQMRTISIDTNKLEETCRKYWVRQNAAHRHQIERSKNCHYCGGSPVVGTDFFGESFCDQCCS